MSLPDLFKSRAFVWIHCKQRFPAKNARTLRQKERAQFIGKK